MQTNFEMFLAFIINMFWSVTKYNLTVLSYNFLKLINYNLGNAFRIMQNMRASNGVSKSNFFFNDYMTKRARFGTYLFSFGGLVMFQDELYEERNTHNSNLDSLTSFCHSLKVTFFYFLV